MSNDYRIMTIVDKPFPKLYEGLKLCFNGFSTEKFRYEIDFLCIFYHLCNVFYLFVKVK